MPFESVKTPKGAQAGGAPSAADEKYGQICAKVYYKGYVLCRTLYCRGCVLWWRLESNVLRRLCLCRTVYRKAACYVDSVL